MLSVWPYSSPHLLPEEIFVILPRKNSFLLWKNQVKIYKDWIKVLTNNVLVDYHFGPHLASIRKQNVFIDIYKQFGVTASGINNAIELARKTFNFNPEAEIVLYIKQGEYFIDNTLHFDNIKPGINYGQEKKTS